MSDEFAMEARAVATEAHRLAAEGGSPAEREAFTVRKAALLAQMAEPLKADGRDWDVVAVVGLVHPEVVVRLTGTDGNAFAVMGRVTSALTKAGVSKAERDAFLAEAMSGDYDHLLQTAMRWVTVS